MGADRVNVTRFIITEFQEMDMEAQEDTADVDEHGRERERERIIAIDREQKAPGLRRNDASNPMDSQTVDWDFIKITKTDARFLNDF